MQRVIHELIYKGISINESFLPSEKVDRIYQDISNLVKQNSSDIVCSNESEYSYMDILESKFTHIITREGVNSLKYDKGMIDIFHPERQLNYLSMEYLGVTDIVSDLISLGFYFSNYNVYINKGVSFTRPTHYDGLNQIKIFIYLTDVQTLTDGPYAYIPFSNKAYRIFTLSTLIRRLINKDAYYAKNFTWLDRYLVPMLGEKGALIISDQAGLHRGLPQTYNTERMLLVLNFLRKK